ncbi:JAB domain-containing protein [Flavobacterium johnsoniae]|uniref:DNA repair protein radc n=1 Tax=Flavobacterium johnsoniae TaxID=986 RepID=A0A1M5V8C7_FLAJO|nr:JAB domain-containing protein [Flavobacterium johnsoniae]SHH71487.1 DNA repair protein radc [Flavobacterium johnsoniae]
MKTVPNNSWKNVSEIDLIYKTKIKNSQRPHVTSSQYAYSLIKDCWDPGKIEFLEQFKVLLLNQSNKVLGIYEASSGGITSTVVDVRLLFAAALKAGAAGLIIAHNHPSGNVLPSEQDKHITKKISMAGEVLDIKLLDHLIVTSEHYYSFADQGAL